MENDLFSFVTCASHVFTTLMTCCSVMDEQALQSRSPGSTFSLSRDSGLRRIPFPVITDRVQVRTVEWESLCVRTEFSPQESSSSPAPEREDVLQPVKGIELGKEEKGDLADSK